MITLRRVAPGETWVVRQSTHLKKLVIADGGRLEAPPGRTLTLAVNGVGTPVVPGAYTGDVTLNVPLQLRLRDPGLEGEHLRAGLYVQGGLFLPEKSAAALLVGGKVGNGGAAGFSVSSSEPDLTGAVFAGDARYVLSDAHIAVAGPGLLVAGSADVVVGGNSRIEAGGTALRLAGQGSVLLDGADLRAGNGQLAEFLPGAHSALRIRSTRLQGNVAYAPEGMAQAAVTLEGAVLVGAVLPSAAAAVSVPAQPGGSAPTLTLDSASRWVVTGSSWLSALTLAPGAVIAAPEGSALGLFVNGEPATVAPGSYRGQVELRIGPVVVPTLGPVVEPVGALGAAASAATPAAAAEPSPR